MSFKNIIYRTSVLALLIMLMTGFSYRTQSYSIENTTFDRGEKLTYRLHYGLFTGAFPVMKVYDKTYNINNQETNRIEVTGKTVGMFNKLFKVKDVWRSYVDTKTMLPVHSFRQISEGDYKLKENTYINRGIGKVKVVKDKKDGQQTKFYDAPEGIHDIISGFYYYRNLDYNSKKNGDKFRIKAFFEDELYDLDVVYKGKERIKTPLGKIDAYKLVPIVPNNDLFDGEESIVFWLSADKNRIPLKIKADMFVGAVELDLKKHENLRHDINFD